MLKNVVFKNFIFAIALVFFVLGARLAFAQVWQEPGAAPPGGNTPGVIWNSQVSGSQQNASLYISGTARVGQGGAFGGFTPDAVWMVSSPSAYFGSGVAGTIIGAGGGQAAGDLHSDGNITVGGRVGIGTTNPSDNLHVTGNAGNYATIRLGNLVMQARGISNDIYLRSNSDINNNYLITNTASRYYQNAGTHAWETAPSGVAGTAVPFTERMRLSLAGGLSLGSGVVAIDAGAGNLLVQGDVSLRSNAQQQIRFIDAAGGFLGTILKSGANIYLYGGGDGTTPAAQVTGTGLLAGGDNQKDLGSAANAWRNIVADGDVTGTRLCIGIDCRNAWPVAGGGDITDVTAGNGLTGGGVAGAVTLNVVGGTGITSAADLVSLDTTYTDGRYVNVTGDTMTGALGGTAFTASGDVTGTRLCIGADCRAAWPVAGGGGDITGVIAGVGMTGGGLSGDVTLSLDATHNDGSAFDGRFVNVPGDTMTGSLVISGVASNLSVGGGGAFGGFAPDATWKVSSPNAYFGNGVAGTIIGAGGGQAAGDITTDGALIVKGDVSLRSNAQQQIRFIDAAGGFLGTILKSGANIYLYGGGDGTTPAAQVTGTGLLAGGDNQKDLGSAANAWRHIVADGDVTGTRLCIGVDCRNAWPVAGGGGDITGVIAGTGMTGGGLSGDVTLSLDATHNDGSAFDGRFINTTGDTMTGLFTAAGVGISLGGVTRTTWPTDSGGDITDVTAGNGLTGGGASGAVTLNVVGGTGITSAADLVSLDTVYTDGRYVNVPGDTMTGSLVIGAGNLEVSSGGIAIAGASKVAGELRTYGNMIYLDENAEALNTTGISFRGNFSTYFLYKAATGNFEMNDDLTMFGSLNIQGGNVSAVGGSFSADISANDGTFSGSIATNGAALNATYGVNTQGDYGVRGIGNSAATSYGVYGHTSGGTTRWSGYFAGLGAAPYSNVYVGDNLLVGATAEGMLDAAFSLNGNDAYFSGDIGVNGNIYTDGDIRFSTVSLGVCDASLRGTLRFVEGGAGVKDTLAVCAKSALDTYAWRTIY